MLAASCAVRQMRVAAVGLQSSMHADIGWLARVCVWGCVCVRACVRVCVRARHTALQLGITALGKCQSGFSDR